MLTIVDSTRNGFVGWNHVKGNKTEFSAPFNALIGQASDYEISQNRYQPNVNCDKAPTLNVNLVAKLSDWDKQHVNGLEANLSNRGETSPPINFDQFAYLVLDLSVVSERTRIKSVTQIADHYQDIVSRADLNQLDQGKANLQLTLFEEGATDQSTKSLNASTIITIDQLKMADQWLRVTIARDDFDFFFEQQYRKSTVNTPQLAGIEIAGLRITAETALGKQLRNLMGDDWRASVPETFKDIGLEISQAFFVKRDPSDN